MSKNQLIACLRAHHIRPGKFESVDDLLLDFSGTVLAIERGTLNEFYDYLNAMSVRDVIQCMIESTALCGSAVAELDLRLRAASEPYATYEIKLDKYPRQIFWWYYRKPYSCV